MRNDPEAMIFDLDGVITFTARVHAAAWKQLFDEFLKARSVRLHQPYREFTLERDYLTYVDGKPPLRWSCELPGFARDFYSPRKPLRSFYRPDCLWARKSQRQTYSTKKSNSLEWMSTKMR
jgi:hypothetical protein